MIDPPKLVLAWQKQTSSNPRTSDIPYQKLETHNLKPKTLSAFCTVFLNCCYHQIEILNVIEEKNKLRHGGILKLTEDTSFNYDCITFRFCSGFICFLFLQCFGECGPHYLI